jgi:hypothetical protein
MLPLAIKGVDPSAGFLDHAKAHISDPRATFDVADAQSLAGKRRPAMGMRVCQIT